MITAQEARQLADDFNADFNSRKEEMQEDLYADIMADIRNRASEGKTHYYIDSEPLTDETLMKIHNQGYSLFSVPGRPHRLRVSW
jgi:hypothetical protein